MRIRAKYFLFTQILFLLVSYVFLFFIKNDSLLLSFFYYSLFLSFLIFHSYLKSLLLNNLLIYLIIFLFLYGIFNGTIEYILESEISKNTYFATLIYASIIPSFLLGFVLNKKLNKEISFINNTPRISFYNPFSVCVLFLLILYKSFYFYKLGLLLNPSVLKTTSRLELFDDFGQFQIVSSFLISSIFLYFIYNYSLIPKLFKNLILLLLLYYIAIQLSVGNRKEFVSIILGFFWLIVEKRKYKFSILKFILILVLIFLFLVLGSVRANLSLNSNSTDLSSILISTLTSNEFVYPFETLKISVQNYFSGTLEFIYGLSVFLYPVLIFIPRIIFPFKFESLAVTFVQTNFGGGMGYAYSPVTESFINFGLFGPAIIFFIIGYLVTNIFVHKNAKYSFLLFTLIPDFCRGEFSTFFYQLFFQVMFLITLPFLLKLAIRKNFI
jgi:oligosaccharide repeat unit polymerase